MERESFEDPVTAAYMNEHFVNVKVDREERPDIDALYMEAVQAISGQGGWPMTVFLDPDGVPFYGGTYFPPDDSRGMPSFRMVMEAVLDAYREPARRAPRAGAADPGAAGRDRRARAFDRAPRRASLERALDGLRERADGERGGFGGAPKFPPASALELLLARGETAHVERTLDAMMARRHLRPARRRLRPLLGRRRWLVPHFEKMLYDNALLAARLPARLAGARARSLPARLRGDAGLDAARDARPRGRLLLGPRRRLRGRGGPLLRLDPGRRSATCWATDAEEAIEFYGVTVKGNFEGAQRPPPRRRRRRRAQPDPDRIARRPA